MAVVQGFCTCPTPPKAVVLSPRNAAKAAALKEQFPALVTIAESNAAVLERADWVFVATPPGPANAGPVLADLPFRAEHTVVSFIAGISPELLAEHAAPASTVVQAFPLPPAADHKSTTVMVPKNAAVEAVLATLGGTVPVDSFEEAMKIGACSCVMGDFYAHLRAVHEWLEGQGIESGTASTAVASYFATFGHASARAGAGGFGHLVAEQTPGGMNEQVIAELQAKGNYDNVKAAMTNLLPRLLG
eukprot:g7143.t1